MFFFATTGSKQKVSSSTGALSAPGLFKLDCYTPRVVALELAEMSLAEVQFVRVNSFAAVTCASASTRP